MRLALLLLLCLAGCNASPRAQAPKPGAVRVAAAQVEADLPACLELLWAGCRFLWCEKTGLYYGTPVPFSGLAPLGPCNPGAEDGR